MHPLPDRAFKTSLFRAGFGAPAGPEAGVLNQQGKRIKIALAVQYKILYILRMNKFKPVIFLGSSLDDLRTFPVAARREAGYQLDLVQHGHEPEDWKAMPTIGQGVLEIRIRDASGAYRVIYVAKFSNTIHVLHCFQKKSQKTSRQDLALAESRYRELLKESGK